MMSEQNYSVVAVDGKVFEIPPHLWLQNQQQQALLLRYLACPLQENEQQLWLGIDNLNNLAACETFSFLTGKVIEPILLQTEALKSLLQQLSPQANQIEENAFMYSRLPHTENTQDTDIAQKSDEPIIQLLDNIFEQALVLKASDIHFEPQPQCLQVRFRIDGVLQVQPSISSRFANRVVSRLKLLAKLDISETRLPQDGRFHFKTTFSDLLDLRLSTLPTPLGEKAVLRVQQNKPVQFSFAELGMNERQLHHFENALNQPQGLILVTGPTGSGKSISLYTALSYLNRPEKHIMTAEDPIEIELSGIIQTQINPHIGLDFSRLLRTFLRQDPDIIMLGEIRDEESAEMALRAAQTGHLVLSTLHTNDAPSAISRLLQLGIKQHEIDHSLLLVIAQRLVRKCCTKCGAKNESFCDCYQGYRGRIGLYQFLRPIKQDETWHYELDFQTLHQAGLEKVRQGITDLEEVERVLGREE
ncbi:GspE/PulE family protein [Pasteurellaceae bacterium 22721_9_1]